MILCPPRPPVLKDGKAGAQDILWYSGPESQQWYTSGWWLAILSLFRLEVQKQKLCSALLDQSQEISGAARILRTTFFFHHPSCSLVSIAF